MPASLEMTLTPLGSVLVSIFPALATAGLRFGRLKMGRRGREIHVMRGM